VAMATLFLSPPDRVRGRVRVRVREGMSC